MRENLVNSKVILLLSDPFELGEALGWPALDATVCHTKIKSGEITSIVIKLTNSFNYKITHCEYFVASPRHEGVNFNQLQSGEPVISALTRVSVDQINSDKPFDLSSWRGGVAIIGDIKQKNQ